jgi:PAS domain S-box-containing protein
MSREASELLATVDESKLGVEWLICKLRLLIRQLEKSNEQLSRALVEAGETNDHFRRIFEEAPIGYVALDARGKVLEVNAAGANQLGVPRQRLLGRSLGELVPSMDGERLERRLRQVGNGEAVPALELRLSEHAITRVRVSLLGGRATRAAARYLLTLEDRTELARLNENELRFSQISAHVEDVYYQTDDAGQVVYLSSAYERVWRRPVVRAHGQPWFGSVHADDLAQANEARRLLLKGDPFDEEYRIVRPDGEVRWVRDRAFLLDHPGRGIVGVARDVTDDRDLEEELRQAQKLEAIGTLASSVAHDFGNLLQGVMGCLNIALSESTTLERSRDYTRQALMAVRGGASLVGQLTKFGRRDRVQPRAVPLDAAITDCAKLLQRLLGDHIELQIEANAPDAKILADPVQIEQILMNLAANARDAMPCGGHLLIRTDEVRETGSRRRGRTMARLEVRDVGCGMDGETQARVFEPFFTTKVAGKGTGLGLSAVRAVTRALGGQVDVESEVGRGTAFVFRFPVVLEAPVAPPRKLREVHFAGRVLLVEDDWRVRVSVRQFLEGLGFEVVEAGDAAEALAQSNGSLALLVTDVMLPEVSGPRIREILAEQHPELKALYISAHSAPYLMDHGLLTKNDVILQKPFEMQDLAFRLTELYSPEVGLTQLARGGFESRPAQCGRA